MTGDKDERIARAGFRMFERNAGTYAHPALVETAWLDADVRGFWLEQAAQVAHDLEAQETLETSEPPDEPDGARP